MALITSKSLEDWKQIMLTKWKELVPNINTSLDSMVSIDATVIAEVAFLLEQDLITQTNNSFLAYATGDELSNLGLDRGIPRKEATKSNGVVIFSREEKAFANYLISKGTIISTTEDLKGNILTFETTEDKILYGVINKPNNLTANISNSGNIGDGTYNYLVTSIAGDGKETDGVEIQVVIDNGNSNNSIELSWNTVARADKYNIYLGGKLLNVSNVNSYIDTIGETNKVKIPPIENETGNTEVEVNIQSLGKGSIYNVGINTITKFIETPIGIETVNNPKPTIGGSNTEKDEEYRERIRTGLINNSGKTTAKGYENTALSVEGVASATAVHEDGEPANKITVFITSSDINNPTPTQELLDKVTLELNKDENRAVCDNLIAKAAIVHPINISIDISEYDSINYTQENITNNISNNIISFMKTIPTEGTFRVVDLSNIIHDTEGVIDFTINEPIENYTTGPNETVSLGILTVNY